MRHLFKIFSTGILFILPHQAFAFHTIHCGSEDTKMNAVIFSDAHFGVIINAELKYNDKKIHYTASQDPGSNPFACLHNGIVVIPFESGENIVMSSDEKNLSVYDGTGLYKNTLICGDHNAASATKEIL